MDTFELIPGSIYKHYKGKEYKIHGLALHSETLEEVVIYEALYQNNLGKMWVRPKKMFLEVIEFEGVKQPRFQIMKEHN